MPSRPIAVWSALAPNSIRNTKVALMTYKARHSKEPSYLYSILHDYIPTRVLRSSDQHLLEKQKSFTTKASRAFRNGSGGLEQLVSKHSLCNITREFQTTVENWTFCVCIYWQLICFFRASESPSHVKACTLNHRCKKTLTPRIKNVKKRVFYWKIKNVKKRWIKNVVEKLTKLIKPSENSSVELLS